MCGRYVLTTPADVLARLYAVDADAIGIAESLPPRYNLAPTQLAPVVRMRSDGRRHLDLLHWGLVPFWAEQPQAGSRMINARAETVAEKPAYRKAFARRRCLVPADGFYEWRRLEKGKQPYLIHRADGRPMALAGLWERWRDEQGQAMDSFTILTTQANAAVSPLHDRMPVILDAADWPAWLDPESEPRRLQAMLHPAPEGALELYPVSTRVNSPANDDATILRRVDEPVREERVEDSGQGTLF